MNKFTFLLLVFFLLLSSGLTRDASAQDCSTGTETEMILCQLDALSSAINRIDVKVNSLHVKADSLEERTERIEGLVSPAFSLTGQYCIEGEFLDLAIDLGFMDFGWELNSQGQTGAEVHGSGAFLKGNIALDPFTAAANAGIGGALKAVHCFNLPERVIQGGPFESIASKQASRLSIASTDLQEIYNRSAAIEDGLAGQVGALSNRIADPTNYARDLNAMLDLVSVPASPGDAFSNVVAVTQGIDNVLPLPPSVSRLLRDPLSVLDVEMDYDELCRIEPSLPAGEIKQRLRENCEGEFPVPEPIAFVINQLELNDEAEGAIWLARSYREEWQKLYATIGAGSTGGNVTLGVEPTVNLIWDRLDSYFPESSHTSANDFGTKLAVMYDRVSNVFPDDASAVDMRTQVSNASSRMDQLFDPASGVIGVRGQLSIVHGVTTALQSQISTVHDVTLSSHDAIGTVHGVVVSAHDAIGTVHGVVLSSHDAIGTVHGVTLNNSLSLSGLDKKISAVQSGIGEADLSPVLDKLDRIVGVREQLSIVDDEVLSLISNLSTVHTIVGDTNWKVYRELNNDINNAKQQTIDGVANKIFGRICGGHSPVCTPFRDDDGTGDIFPTKRIPGVSDGSGEFKPKGESSASDHASKVGVQSAQAFEDLVAPADYFMDAAYPNPSQSQARVQFGLPQAESVRLSVFDTAGREVTTAINQRLPAGRHAMDLDLSGLASGTYFYRVEAGAWISSKTITIAR